MRVLRPLLVLCLLLLTVAEAQARRLALVIGNDAYANLEVLQKAVADARSYAGVLEEQGFAVTLRTDATRQQMDDAIADFIDAIQPGDTAAFVYSGHGWSDGLQNYVLGTDIAAGGSQERLSGSSIAIRNGATGVLDRMDRRGATLKVAIIDACRNNPFIPAAGGRGAGLERGLVRIDPPQGTFLVFSASPGQTALDRLSDRDGDANSVFTRVFVPLVRSGLALEDAMNEAQQAVLTLARAADGHAQQPAYVDEVPGKTCLAGDCAAPGAAPAPDAGEQVVIALLDVIARTADRNLVAGFVSNPNGRVRAAALARLAELPISPDGRDQHPAVGPGLAIRSVLASAGDDNTIRLWDPDSGTQTHLLAGHTQWVYSVAFSPDGTRLASAGADGTVRLWDTDSGALLRIFAGHKYAVNAVAFSPDGTRLASGSADSTVRVWNVASGDQVHVLTLHTGSVTAVAFSPSGTRLASTSSSDGKLRIWDVATGHAVNTLNVGAVNAIAFSADGSTLALATLGPLVELWDVEGGDQTGTLEGHSSWVTSVTFSRDGTRIATSGADSSVRLWDAASRTQIRVFRHASIVYSVAFSPDGATLASGNLDDTIRIWAVADGQLIRTLTGHAGDVLAVAFSPIASAPAVAGR